MPTRRPCMRLLLPFSENDADFLLKIARDCSENGDYVGWERVPMCARVVLTRLLSFMFELRWLLDSCMRCSTLFQKSCLEDLAVTIRHTNVPFLPLLQVVSSCPEMRSSCFILVLGLVIFKSQKCIQWTTRPSVWCLPCLFLLTLTFHCQKIQCKGDVCCRSRRCLLPEICTVLRCIAYWRFRTFKGYAREDCCWRRINSWVYEFQGKLCQ